MAVTRAAEAYAKIRSAILDLEFPPDSPLSEAQLAQGLGISRTPVREALKLLEREGLVRSYPARGTFVADLSVADVLEIYQVRLLLEPYAASVAATELSDQDLSALRDSVGRAETALAEQRVEDATALDIRLHGSIVSSTGNRRLKQILAQMDDQVHRIRGLASRDSSRMARTLEEHGLIVDALVARDGRGAENAMRVHLTAARDHALRISVAQRATSEVNLSDLARTDLTPK